ncbi:MAG: hypothetical protein K9K65_04310 [Desulfarculaceae bacterium]|nr:hypothetical protein [Desulfarculaceae bacterium]MCF8097044.1 hypothetical protein [Desulfarculaceae bacterium]MCF8121587.1 hypothetical protein [Desulfarculaceae bacterium]
MRRMINSGGGQAATAACALARLGHRVSYAGAVGDDQAGRLAQTRLGEFGVDTGGLVVKPGARSQEAFILVEEGGGERTIVWARDETCRLEPDDLSREQLVSCRLLHLDGHFIAAGLEAARVARAAGAVVTLDAERVREGTAELVSLCHVVMGDRDFAQRLTGKDNPTEALKALADMGPLWAGRTMGEGGAQLLAKGELFSHPGFAVRALDTTGAGDVFHAGMADAILLGQGPGQTLASACALAAISVTALGGRTALPDRAGLEAFLRQHAS